MLRGRLLGALAVGLLAVFAAPAQAVRLVNPDGTPVGGKWQRWADQAKVPTYRGRVIFAGDPSKICTGNVPGCSRASAPWDPRPHPPYELAASDRDSLYFELGHIFDWANLTWPGRRRLALRIWRTRWHWKDTARGLAQNTEDGLEGMFPVAYSACAWGDDLGGFGAWVGWGVTVPMPPDIYPVTNTATCAFIKHVGIHRRY